MQLSWTKKVAGRRNEGLDLFLCVILIVLGGISIDAREPSRRQRVKSRSADADAALSAVDPGSQVNPSSPSFSPSIAPNQSLSSGQRSGVNKAGRKKKMEVTSGSGSGSSSGVGGYSRTYSERRYEIRKNIQREKHTNQKVETETRLTFHGGATKNPATGQAGRQPPVGATIIRHTNNTFSFPTGQNLTSEFRNITYHAGSSSHPSLIPEEEEEDDGGEEQGEDGVHPLYFVNGGLDEEVIRGSAANCENRACYPATGNLLVGRENRLSASSTCGINKEERYCLVSRNLEEPGPCFTCDSRPKPNQYSQNPGLSHRIENVVHRFSPGQSQQSWWQSESGVDNVTVRLDLEAEFQLTHLVISFRTPRPAAMVIERSFDFGTTWEVPAFYFLLPQLYKSTAGFLTVLRYFAENCSEAFPGIGIARESPDSNSLFDVVCETKYSRVTPYTNGKVILPLLPRNLTMSIPLPDVEQAENLLKITNLRVNFTKLHRHGVIGHLYNEGTKNQEKNFSHYSIYEMVVRGSCSCHGHAAKCLPLDDPIQDDRLDLPGQSQSQMVHPRCDCVHNTTGLNCELCAPFHHDLPWRPATGNQTNACKRCNCHNHSDKCHFDRTVFERSGRVSGGVCDNCRHHTTGQNCEECKPFFYLSPSRVISDIDACQPCDCDPRGSLDNGLCDQKTDPKQSKEAGRCHCKDNVTGRRCNECQPGFWNLNRDNDQGCQPCTCHESGTVGHPRGCNMDSGECTCKKYVRGRDCDECLPEFYWDSSDSNGNDNENGCSPCSCDVGGSLDNNCDPVTGQCRCRAHVGGRNCSSVNPGFFAPALDHLRYEAELANQTPRLELVAGNASVGEDENDGRVSNWNKNWTGVGFVRAVDNSSLNFTVSNIVSSMEYDLIIRYQPTESSVPVTVVVTPQSGPTPQTGDPDPNGPCAKTLVYGGTIQGELRQDSAAAKVYPPICFEAGRVYSIHLRIGRAQLEPMTTEQNPTAVLIDSIVLIPRVDKIPFFNDTDRLNEHRKQIFDRYECANFYLSASVSRQKSVPEECRPLLHSIGVYLFNGALECQCDITGSTSAQCDPIGGQCFCKDNVMGRHCDQCVPGSFGFGPEGCKKCECNPSGAVGNSCDAKSGQCRCRESTRGHNCDQCQEGYWNFPHCQRCDCRGHADVCDPKTGACTNCRGNATGDSCDRCREGFYGDPRPGVDIPCRPCPCPGTTDSGHSFASRCALDPHTQDVLCECREGYAGSRCDLCADNFYGNPRIAGGECRPCFCNKNVDLSLPGACDRDTGECLHCLFNTAGFNCDKCRSGFYGSAIDQSCQQCRCDLLGTNSTAGPCDPSTGQCPCLANVEGKSCNKCATDYWKIAGGNGCEPCLCDRIGSLGSQCHEYDGQCSCRPGFGGRQCDQCQSNFWGDPTIQCHPCDCNMVTSASTDCDRNTGNCRCIDGLGGRKCDQCAPGHVGSPPNCSSCGECFESWTNRLETLKGRASRVVQIVSSTKQQKVKGTYTTEFDSLKGQLGQTDLMLRNHSSKLLLTSDDLEQLLQEIDTQKSTFAATSNQLDAMEKSVEDFSQRTLWTNASLGELERNLNQLQSSALSFKESTVHGALNSARAAKRKYDEAVRRTQGAKQRAVQSAGKRRQVQTTLSKVEDLKNPAQQSRHQALILRLERHLANLSNGFPQLSRLVCDTQGAGEGNSCDALCGGAGCRKCGGATCENGAMWNSQSALKYAQDALKQLKMKDEEISELLRFVAQVKSQVDQDNAEAKTSLSHVNTAINSTHNLMTTLKELQNAIGEYLGSSEVTSSSAPQEIRTLAQEILSKAINLDPEKLGDLTNGIQTFLERNRNPNMLGEIQEIVRATENDLRQIKRLEQLAQNSESTAKTVFQQVLQVTQELDQTVRAQEQARQSIQKAGDDIKAAELTLQHIGREKSEAEKTVVESMQQIDHHKSRVDQLHRKAVANERGREESRRLSESAIKNLTEIQQSSFKLKQLQLEAQNSLQAKLQLSPGVRIKEEVQNRANRITNNVNDKLRQLEVLEREFMEQERKTGDLTREIDALTYKMEEEMGAIMQIEDYHRGCNS